MRTRRRTFLATGLVALLTIAGVTAAIANDPPPRIAFLANGIVPADALAAGPIAGQLGAPIFTTAPDTLPTSTADAMSDYAPQLVIVMGGPVAISDAVVAQVSAATGLSVASPTPPPTSGIVRAAGQDRFETAAAAAALLAAYDPAYLPTDMKAIDSDKLDGKDSSAFQPAGNYLGKTEKAADSEKLDGKDSSSFADAGHDHLVARAFDANEGVTGAATDLVTVNMTLPDPCGGGTTRHNVLASATTSVQDSSGGNHFPIMQIQEAAVYPDIFGEGSAFAEIADTSVEAENLAAHRLFTEVTPGSHTYRLRIVSQQGDSFSASASTLVVQGLGWSCGPSAASATTSSNVPDMPATHGAE